MMGAIAGDVIGSYYEGFSTKDVHFSPLFHEHSTFTDDSVLTIAVADWLLSGGDLVDVLHDYFHRFPQAGYGGSFTFWAGDRKREPYNSYGNGSAMRVSPVAYAFDSLEEVLDQAEQSAAVTHNHPDGIAGAQSTAAAIFLARMGHEKREIKAFIETTYRYDLEQSLNDIRPSYGFDVSCQGSVPQSIVAFLESTDYESAVRNAISLGGDADTMACIAGSIAEAFYGPVPPHIERNVMKRLPRRLRSVIKKFRRRYLVSAAD